MEPQRPTWTLSFTSSLMYSRSIYISVKFRVIISNQKVFHMALMYISIIWCLFCTWLASESSLRSLISGWSIEIAFALPNQRNRFHRYCRLAWNYASNILLDHFNVLIKICTRDLNKRIFSGMNVCRCNLIDPTVDKDLSRAIFNFIE
jgi:hypothetical protein